LVYCGNAFAVALPVTLTNVHIVTLAPRSYGFYLPIYATLTSCAQTNSVWVAVDPTISPAQYRDVVSSLQLAYTLGRPVNLYLASCSGGGTAGYPQAVYVDIL
jgi:hypothetical protein